MLKFMGVIVGREVFIFFLWTVDGGEDIRILPDFVYAFCIEYVF